MIDLDILPRNRYFKWELVSRDVNGKAVGYTTSTVPPLSYAIFETEGDAHRMLGSLLMQSALPTTDLILNEYLSRPVAGATP